MPLHDWTDRKGWDGVHHLWISEVLRWVKPRMPAPYRAYIGTAPTVAIGATDGKPDVSVNREAGSANGTPQLVTSADAEEPDVEVAVALIDPATTLFVEAEGRLIAAVEIISPRNKDRPSARANYTSRYVGYLSEGVQLLLVDVHRRPLGFSFPDAIGNELQMQPHACPTPCAVSYRVGEPAATGGRYLGIWRRPLTVDAPLPNVWLPLTVDLRVPVDLEKTYMLAAADAYLA
jgi:hypothetical protein